MLPNEVVWWYIEQKQPELAVVYSSESVFSLVRVALKWKLPQWAIANVVRIPIDSFQGYSGTIGLQNIAAERNTPLILSFISKKDIFSG